MNFADLEKNLEEQANVIIPKQIQLTDYQKLTKTS